MTRRGETSPRLPGLSEHPAGTQFLAAGLWIKTLYETRRLQATLYSSASFYAKEDDKVDPKIVTQFRAWTREAKRLAEARLKQNPKDVEALYYLGTNFGLKASFQGLLSGATSRRCVTARKPSTGIVKCSNLIQTFAMQRSP